MRELYKFKSKKLYVEDLDIALALVREKYPNSYQEGSLGHYLYFCHGVIVGEAWISRSIKKNWWLKIKPKKDII